MRFGVRRTFFFTNAVEKHDPVGLTSRVMKVTHLRNVRVFPCLALPIHREYYDDVKVSQSCNVPRLHFARDGVFRVRRRRSLSVLVVSGIDWND